MDDISNVINDMIDNIDKSAGDKAPDTKEDESAKGADTKEYSEQDNTEGEGEAEEKGDDTAKDEGEGEKEKDEKEDIIDALREQLAELQAELQELKEGKKEEPKATLEPLPFFESDDDFEDSFTNREKFEKVLHKVHNSAVESVLKSVPQLIDNVVRMQVSINMRAADFYKRNPDLKKYATFVGKVANDIVGKDPKVTMDDLFGGEENDGLLGKEVRKRLALKSKADKSAAKMESQQKERPAFIKKPAGARVKDERGDSSLSVVEKQILDLLS